MHIKYTVITTLCLLLTLGLLVSVSNAKIDPEKIVGIWLLDEGDGDAIEDASENEKMALQVIQIGLTGKSTVP